MTNYHQPFSFHHQKPHHRIYCSRSQDKHLSTLILLIRAWNALWSDCNLHTHLSKWGNPFYTVTLQILCSRYDHDPHWVTQPTYSNWFFRKYICCKDCWFQILNALVYLLYIPISRFKSSPSFCRSSDKFISLRGWTNYSSLVSTWKVQLYLNSNVQNTKTVDTNEYIGLQRLCKVISTIPWVS